MKIYCENICRLCLAEKEPHFMELEKDDPLLKTIFNLTSLEAFPSQIDTVLLCEECRQLLLQYDQFRETCLQNNEIFLATLESDKCVGIVGIQDEFPENIKVVIIEEADDEQNLNYDESQILENEQKVVQRDILAEDESRKRPAKVKEEPKSKTRTRAESKAGEKASRFSLANKAKQKNNVKPKSSSFCASTSNRYLPCEQCGKMIRRSNMRKHLDTHNPKPPQLCCSHCGKKYKDSNLLKVHINSHHTFERKYECKECDKVYFRPNSLREHIYAKHSVEKRFECDECGMKFTNFSKKTYHYITAHTVAKPFSCQYCDKAFKLKSDFTLHVRTHTGEKPFSCDICGKKFNKSYNVVIHKKSHRNDESKVVPSTAKTKTKQM
ncbi:zinc finger protein 37-like [Anopheles moucheti]|uniref:zinc finger protein 37-like n=1 Tax=Anopheles moucheti TaxID=186751 RepID=UPI0022F05502|nr:zinc finger protein 37-like [Anopheles moucheti]